MHCIAKRRSSLVVKALLLQVILAGLLQNCDSHFSFISIILSQTDIQNRTLPLKKKKKSEIPNWINIAMRRQWDYVNLYEMKHNHDFPPLRRCWKWDNSTLESTGHKSPSPRLCSVTEQIYLLAGGGLTSAN